MHVHVHVLYIQWITCMYTNNILYICIYLAVFHIHVHVCFLDEDERLIGTHLTCAFICNYMYMYMYIQYMWTATFIHWLS